MKYFRSQKKNTRRNGKNTKIRVKKNKRGGGDNVNQIHLIFYNLVMRNKEYALVTQIHYKRAKKNNGKDSPPPLPQKDVFKFEVSKIGNSFKFIIEEKGFFISFSGDKFKEDLEKFIKDKIIKGSTIELNVREDLFP